ncbi:YezD family protein [Oceanobacillus zhaokaii]|uniref:YezD family protein n=1 Tax=Oceanobacillus zhaokaii TaxID=2052660 RepID=UPI0019644FD7|nr:YezD family protein [Oceanobacillus zhaokaii]
MAIIDNKKIEDIVLAIRNLEYGSLVITVHEGEITQVETTEKKRYAVQGKKTKKINS